MNTAEGERVMVEGNELAPNAIWCDHGEGTQKVRVLDVSDGGVRFERITGASTSGTVRVPVEHFERAFRPEGWSIDDEAQVVLSVPAGTALGWVKALPSFIDGSAIMPAIERACAGDPA